MSARNGRSGFALMELLLAMAVVVVMSAAAWVYLQPSSSHVRTASLLTSINQLRTDLKRVGPSVSGTPTTPYTLLTVPTLYAWGVVPADLAGADTTVMTTPFSTRIHVMPGALASSAGTFMDAFGTGFTIRIVMPEDRSERQDMCAPLVTALARTFPVMGYTTVSRINSTSVGTVVVAPNLPATADRMATVVSTVCNQSSAFLLVVADA